MNDKLLYLIKSQGWRVASNMVGGPDVLFKLLDITPTKYNLFHQVMLPHMVNALGVVYFYMIQWIIFVSLVMRKYGHCLNMVLC